MKRRTFWTSSIAILMLAVLAGTAAAACTEQQKQQERTRHTQECLRTDVSCREGCELRNNRSTPQGAKAVSDCVNGCMRSYQTCNADPFPGRC